MEAAANGMHDQIFQAHVPYIDSITYWDYPITNRITYSSSSGTYLNVWNHVALTANGNTCRIFLNGISVSSSTSCSTRYSFPLTQLLLGSQYDQNAFDFHPDAWIDDFRIWNASLSQADIQSRMSKMLFGNETNLYVYYPFDGYVNNISATICKAALCKGGMNGAIFGSIYLTSDLPNGGLMPAGT